MKTYTIGEILRLGLLKNYKGQPYKDKTSILRIVKGLRHIKINTPWGVGYSVSKDELAKHNGKW